MAIVNRSFSVNVTPGMMPPIVHVSEYDVGRAYTVSILDEQGNTFTIPSGTSASIEGTLNGAVGFTQSATVSNNQVSFTLSQSMTACSGKAWCKIKLTQNSQPIQTCAFILAVDRAGVEAETVIGAPGFEEQINEGVAEYFDNDPPFFELPSGGQLGQALLSDGAGGAYWGQAQSGGITNTEKNLMMTLFRAIPYTSDVHSAVNSLESIWNDETPTSYSITQNLTNCTSSNNASTVASGGSFSAEITANADYDMDSIAVTMGGVDITASAVNGNAISIGSVSGNVVITAVASTAAYTRVKGITQAVNGAYIDTGYYIRPTDTVEFKFAMAVGQWAFVFDATGNGVVQRFVSRPDGVAGRTYITRRKGNWNTNNTDASVPSFGAQSNTTYHVIETTPGSVSVYDESENLLTVSTDANASGVDVVAGKVILFAQVSVNPIVNTSYANQIHLEEFIIHDNEGNEVHHFIPVLDENDVACLYDLVDKEYLYGGSGNDTIEAVIEEASA